MNSDYVTELLKPHHKELFRYLAYLIDDPKTFSNFALTCKLAYKFTQEFTAMKMYEFRRQMKIIAKSIEPNMISVQTFNVLSNGNVQGLYYCELILKRDITKDSIIYSELYYVNNSSIMLCKYIPNIHGGFYFKEGPWGNIYLQNKILIHENMKNRHNNLFSNTPYYNIYYNTKGVRIFAGKCVCGKYHNFLAGRYMIYYDKVLRKFIVIYNTIVYLTYDQYPIKYKNIRCSVIAYAKLLKISNLNSN